MTKLKKRFWLLAATQVCIVMALLVWRFYVTASAYLAHPTDGDMYAHTWSFQAIAFAVFALPLFLIGMGVLLGLEWFIVRLISK